MKWEGNSSPDISGTCYTRTVSDQKHPSWPASLTLMSEVRRLANQARKKTIIHGFWVNSTGFGSKVTRSDQLRSIIFFPLPGFEVKFSARSPNLLTSTLTPLSIKSCVQGAYKLLVLYRDVIDKKFDSCNCQCIKDECYKLVLITFNLLFNNHRHIEKQ